MADLTGIELNKKKSEICDTPCILYTGRGSEEVAEQAFSVGFVDYIKKEINQSHYNILANRIITNVEKQILEHQVFEEKIKIAKMQEVDELKDRFVDSATHELCTPLASLKIIDGNSKRKRRCLHK